MTARLQAAGYFLALSTFACAPQLQRADIERTAARLDRSLEPVIVERSAPSRPAWTQNRGNRGGFLGLGVAPTFEEARARALTDLHVGISSFVSVDLRSVFSSRSHLSGRSSAQAELTSTTASRFSGVKTRELYWERTIGSNLFPDQIQYRVFVRAFIAQHEIARARSRLFEARRKASDRRYVAVLPFDGADALPVAEDIGVQLGRAPKLSVFEPSTVRAVWSDDESQAERIERAREALLPDVVIAGAYQRLAEQLRLTAVLYDGGEGQAIRSISVTGLYAELPALERQLSTKVLDALQPNRALPKTEFETLDGLLAYHEAYAKFSKGELEGALKSIHKAAQAMAHSPRVYLRMGRVLERMGRYGALLSKVAGQKPTELLRACSAQAKLAVQDSLRSLDAHALRRVGQNAPVARGMNVDTAMVTVMLSPVLSERSEKVAEPLKLGTEAPQGAAGSYLRAWRLAKQNEDLRAEVQAVLALAALALRTDRTSEARGLYSAIEAYARSVGAPLLLARALLGQAKSYRLWGDLERAEYLLLRALDTQKRVGSMIERIELQNELGMVLVEQGRLSAALERYERAVHTAERIESQYLRGVLANNLAVLQMKLGQPGRARANLLRAQRILTDLGEADGRLVTYLNLAKLSDGKEAARFSRAAQKIIRRTHQEGRLADLHMHLGATREVGEVGETGSTLFDLAFSWQLYHRLGRGGSARRAQNNLLAMELVEGLRTPDVLDCIKKQYWLLGAPVFRAPIKLREVQTMTTIEPGRLSPLELAVSLNAASIQALSDWAVPYVHYVRSRSTMLRFRLKPKLKPSPRPSALVEPSRMLDPLEQAQRASSLIDRLGPFRSRIKHLIRTARRSRDIIWLNCLNGRAVQLRGLEHISKRHLNNLYQALVTLETSKVEHAYRVIMVAYEKASLLIEEAEQCIGYAQYYSGETEMRLEADISPDVPDDVPQQGPIPYPGPETVARSKKAPEYERILSASLSEPDVLIMFDPPLLERHFRVNGAARAAEELAGVVRHLEPLGLLQLLAVARLNLAALQWFSGAPEQAYETLMVARTHFVQVRDAQGLAYVHEWLGYFFERSRARWPAAEQLGISYRLFELASNATAAQRVLSYGATR